MFVVKLGISQVLRNNTEREFFITIDGDAMWSGVMLYVSKAPKVDLL